MAMLVVEVAAIRTSVWDGFDTTAITLGLTKTDFEEVGICDGVNNTLVLTEFNAGDGVCDRVDNTAILLGLTEDFNKGVGICNVDATTAISIELTKLDFEGVGICDGVDNTLALTEFDAE